MRAVYAQPGFTESDVTNALASDGFVLGDTYTITPIALAPILYTSYQKDMSLIPVYETVLYKTFFTGEVLIDGLRMKASTGIEVDEQDIVLTYPEDDLAYQNRMSWPEALMRGMLDGAVIRRDRYIRQSHETPWIGGWTMFRGRVSGIDTVGRSSANIRVKSNLILLDAQMPRDMFESNCKNTWGDVNCGVTQLDWMVSGVVGASPTRTVLPWSGSGPEYALGKVFMSTGDGTIRIRTISRADATNLYLAYPLDVDPAPGNIIEVYPGCDRTSAACMIFHGDPDWKTRFKGFPFIPVAETAVGVGVGGQEGKGGK